MTGCLYSVIALLLVPHAYAAGLPDTGQTLCANGSYANDSDVMVACTRGSSGDSATYPRQDGRFGRDPMAATGTLSKLGGGAAGFDYSKVANNGSDLPAGAALGSAAADWACTRDNITGLTWEVKTATSTDLQYFGRHYAWYSSDTATNGGDAGNDGGADCDATRPGGCNTQTYAEAVNGLALCGHSDWRLPSTRELETLVHYFGGDWSIDTAYFPTMPIPRGAFFWSASSYAAEPSRAWGVYFDFLGANLAELKKFFWNVRLVRGGPF